jgi:hypothetical protein
MKPVYILVGMKKTGRKLHIHYPNSDYAFCAIGGQPEFATPKQIESMPMCRTCQKQFKRYGYEELTK